MAGKNILDMLSLGRFFPIETGNFTTHNSTLIKYDETIIFPSFLHHFPSFSPTSSAISSTKSRAFVPPLWLPAAAPDGGARGVDSSEMYGI